MVATALFTVGLQGRSYEAHAKQVVCSPNAIYRFKEVYVGSNSMDSSRELSTILGSA